MAFSMRLNLQRELAELLAEASLQITGDRYFVARTQPRAHRTGLTLAQQTNGFGL